MLITLNQEEIEVALRNYVNEQVNIREGHEIVIDLKAGRGENGFSATIDIVPASTVKPAPAPKPQPQRPTPEPVQADPAPALPKDVAETEAAPETTQDAAGEPATETATDAPAQTETAGDTKPADQETAAADPPATDKPRGSLFAGLSKPRNDN